MIDLTWWLVFSAGWILSIFWLIQCFKLTQFIKHYKLTGLVNDVPPPSCWPSVSIIIPARDEELKIQDCLTSIVKSDYSELEIICVDDRSIDQTGNIMDKLAEEDKRIKVVHVHTLPAGWLGKTHAMMSGVQIATGEYFLFTDGDVIYHNKAITHAITYATAHDVDHLCLFPKFISGRFWKNALTTFMGYAFFLIVRPESIPKPSSKAYAGVGAFNLMKKSAYDAVGGMERLRLQVLEDMWFGWLMKTTGHSSELLLADELLQLEWQKGLWGVIRGVEKNLYASMNFSLLQAIISTIMVFVMLFMLYGTMFLLDDARISGFVFALLIVHVSYGYYAVKNGKGWNITWAFPFAVLLNLYALWRSVIITHYQGGIRWRDSFYSLKMLKGYADLNNKKQGIENDNV